MKYDEIKNKIEYKVEMRGYHHEQSDMVIRASIDKNLVGLLYYSVFRDEPSISMIEVSPDYRRKGVARGMVYKLQDMYPDTEIDWGMLTDDGSMLYNTMNFIEIPVFDEKRYERLKKKYDDLTNHIHNNWDKVTEKQKRDWYRLEHMIYYIENSPQFEKRVKKIIKTN